MTLVAFSGYNTGAILGEANSTTGAGSSLTLVTSPLVAGGAYSVSAAPVTTANCVWSLGTSNASGAVTTFAVTGTIYFGVFFQYTLAPASGSEDFCGLRTSANYKAVLRLNSARQIEVYDSTETNLVATGSTVLVSGMWYYISGFFGDGTGVPYLVAINNVVELQGTITTGAGTYQAFRIGKLVNRNGNSVQYYYGRIEVSDSEIPTMFGRMITMRPVADGTTAQWTSGNVADWNGVKELPTDDDVTYIMNPAVANQVNLVALNTVQQLGIFGAARGFKAWSRTREDQTLTTSGTRLRILTSGTSVETTGLNGTTTYANMFTQRTTDPSTSAAWTLDGLNNTQVGVTDTTNIQVRCTTLAGFVSYVPLPGPGMMGVG